MAGLLDLKAELQALAAEAHGGKGQNHEGDHLGGPAFLYLPATDTSDLGLSLYASMNLL